MDWYEEEVEQLTRKRDELSYQPETIFYGSSSIRLWEYLYDDFKPFLPVNLGFGGSTLEACVYFFDRIIMPLRSAKKIVMYAGDNDLGDGKSPEEVFTFFKQLEALITAHFPSVAFYYVSVKPSIARWNINDSIKQLNSLIKEDMSDNHNMHFVNIYDTMLNGEGYPKASYFEEDGLHLSRKGYEVWKQVLLTKVFAD